MSLRTLSLKLVMLLTLITGQRVQTLHSLDLTFMNIEDDHVNIEIHEIWKTSKPRKHLPPLSFPAFVEQPRLCIRVITKLPNSEQSYKGKVKTHNYINRQNQSTTGKLWKPYWPWLGTSISKEMVGWIRF
jgi:hypothetical protein